MFDGLKSTVEQFIKQGRKISFGYKLLISGAVGFGFYSFAQGKKAYEVHDVVDDMVNYVVSMASSSVLSGTLGSVAGFMLPAFSGLGNRVADIVAPWETKDDVIPESSIIAGAVATGVITFVALLVVEGAVEEILSDGKSGSEASHPYQGWIA